MAQIDDILEAIGKGMKAAIPDYADKVDDVISGARKMTGSSIRGEAIGGGRRAFSERGIHGTIHNYKKGDTAGKLGDSVKKAFTHKDGETLAYGTIAGSYMAASAGYRVVSGGGVYRDKNGNTNLIGVPFV